MSGARGCCCTGSIDVCTKCLSGATSAEADWCCRTGEEKVVLKINRNAWTISAESSALGCDCPALSNYCTSRSVCPGADPIINVYDCIGSKTFVDRSYGSWLPPRCNKFGQFGGIYAGVWAGKCYMAAGQNAVCCEGSFNYSDPPTAFDPVYTEEAGTCQRSCQLGHLDFYRQLAAYGGLGELLARPLSPGQYAKANDDEPAYDWALDIVSWDPNDNGASESATKVYRSRIFKHYDKTGAEITGSTGLKKHWLCETLVAMIHCEVWFESSECSDVPAPPGDVSQWGCRVPHWVIQGCSAGPVFSWALWQNTTLTSGEKTEIASHLYPDGSMAEYPLSDSLAAKLVSSGVYEIGDYTTTLSADDPKPVKVKLPETIYEPVGDASETSVDAADIFDSTTHWYFWAKPGGWTWACSDALESGVADAIPQIPRRYSNGCNVASLFPDEPIAGTQLQHSRADCFTAAPVPQVCTSTTNGWDNIAICDPVQFPVFPVCSPAIGDVCSGDTVRPECDGMHVVWNGYNPAAIGLGLDEFASCAGTSHAYFWVMDDLAETSTTVGGISSCAALAEAIANKELETDTQHFPPVGLAINYGGDAANFCACAVALNTHSGPSTAPSAYFSPCDAGPSDYADCDEELTTACPDDNVFGPWMVGEKYPCAFRRGACCNILAGTCQDGVTKTQCDTGGGDWHEDEECGDGPPFSVCS